MAKPIYAIVGTDPFLQTEQLLKLLAEMPKDTQRMDLDGERATLAEVLDELRSFSMFGSGKLVVVRDADDFLSKYRPALEDYAAAPSDSGTLVLRLSSLPATQRIHKAISKTGEVLKCDPPRDNDLPAWVMNRAKAVHKLIVPLDAAALLSDRIGADLGRLDNELAKLALQVPSGKIDAQTVSTTIAFQREREMWDMTNMLATGKTTEAIRRWRQLVQADSSTEFRAVTWLSMWLENVRKALSMKQRGMPHAAIGKQLRIWPSDLVEPFFKTAGALGEAGAVDALHRLAELDRRAKSGLGNVVDLVEMFILSFAGSATPRGR